MFASRTISPDFLLHLKHAMTEAVLATTPAAVLPTEVRDRLPTVNGYAFRMVPVRGSTFDMGDEAGDLWDACRPVHTVRLDD